MESEYGIPTLELERKAETDTYTEGELWLIRGVVSGNDMVSGFGAKTSIFSTLEPPWLENKPNRSRIPAGTYKIKPRRYNKGGYDSFEIVGVPGRSLILFHAGNVPRNTRGCVLIGERAGPGWLKTGSKQVFEQFMQQMRAGIVPEQITIKDIGETPF